MSGVNILHFLKDLMEIHSNSPKLYYGFKIRIICFVKLFTADHFLAHSDALQRSLALGNT